MAQISRAFPLMKVVDRGEPFAGIGFDLLECGHEKRYRVVNGRVKAMGKRPCRDCFMSMPRDEQQRRLLLVKVYPRK